MATITTKIAISTTASKRARKPASVTAHEVPGTDGTLVVHKSYGGPGWTLTHEPTGFAFGHSFARKEYATRFGQYLFAHVAIPGRWRERAAKAARPTQAEGRWVMASLAPAVCVLARECLRTPGVLLKPKK